MNAWGKKGNRVRLLFNQLSESEESDVEENKTEKAAPSSGRKYIPPKIAPMHYGKVTVLCFIIIVMVKLVLIFISNGIKNLSLNLPETAGTLLLHKILKLRVELEQNSPE